MKIPAEVRYLGHPLDQSFRHHSQEVVFLTNTPTRCRAWMTMQPRQDHTWIDALSPAADLRLCYTATLTQPSACPEPERKRPWSLRDRLNERDIANLID